MAMTYRTEGDYQLPNLTVPEMPTVGKYGMLRRNYLRNHRNGIYTGMMLAGTLGKHLMETDRQASKMLEELTTQMAQSQGVTESLKASDQMKWVSMMNSILASAEEIVLKELVYN